MRDFLNDRGMASQERAYLEPPCPKEEWVECLHCGLELLEEDAYWIDAESFCGKECFEEFWDENQMRWNLQKN